MLKARLAAFLGGTQKAHGDERLSGILSAIDQEIARAAPLRVLLELLDASRDSICELFRDRLSLPAAARAMTVKVSNLCVARYHFRARSTTVLSQPYGLVVDPINNCNLACPGCVHSERSRALKLFDWNSGMLSPECYAELLRRQGPYAVQITLCNYGEPTMNPATPGFIRKAKSYLAATSLSTNMTSKRFDAEAYAQSGLDFMTLSIDGATQGVYEKYRKKGDIELVFSNIRALVEAKRRLGKGTPVLSWQFLAFEHNVHEIELAIAMARELGVDQIKIATPFDVSWDEPGILPAAIMPYTVEISSETQRCRTDNWNPFPEELDSAAIDEAFETRWVDRLAANPDAANAPAKRSEHMCHWLYKNMVMDAGGRVIPCCAAPRPDADLVFDKRNGAAVGDSFNTEKYRLARLSFADKDAYRAERSTSPLETEPHCANCDWHSDQQAALVDRPEIEKYLRTAPAGVFGARSIEILAGS